MARDLIILKSSPRTPCSSWTPLVLILFRLEMWSRVAWLNSTRSTPKTLSWRKVRVRRSFRGTSPAVRTGGQWTPARPPWNVPWMGRSRRRSPAALLTWASCVVKRSLITVSICGLLWVEIFKIYQPRSHGGHSGAETSIFCVVQILLCPENVFQTHNKKLFLPRNAFCPPQTLKPGYGPEILLTSTSSCVCLTHGLMRVFNYKKWRWHTLFCQKIIDWFGHSQTKESSFLCTFVI